MRLLVLTVLTACTPSPWSDFPAPLRAVAADESMTWWPRVVHAAADVWNNRLRDVHCDAPAFLHALPGQPELDDGHNVVLVPNAQWHEDTWEMGTYDYDGVIKIRQPGTTTDDTGDAGRFMVGMLVHELGHAMGLPHSNLQSSVMNAYPSTGEPSYLDALDARDSLDCGAR